MDFLLSDHAEVSRPCHLDYSRCQLRLFNRCRKHLEIWPKSISGKVIPFVAGLVPVMYWFHHNVAEMEVFVSFISIFLSLSPDKHEKPASLWRSDLCDIVRLDVWSRAFGFLSTLLGNRNWLPLFHWIPCCELVGSWFIFGCSTLPEIMIPDDQWLWGSSYQPIVFDGTGTSGSMQLQWLLASCKYPGACNMNKSCSIWQIWTSWYLSKQWNQWNHISILPPPDLILDDASRRPRTITAPSWGAPSGGKGPSRHYRGSDPKSWETLSYFDLTYRCFAWLCLDDLGCIKVDFGFPERHCKWGDLAIW